MNSDTLIRQLTEADIYAPDHELPETARTSTVALTEIRRRIDMDAKELTKPAEREPQRRSGWLVAAAAFASIVLVAGLIALVASREAETPTATTTPTTVASPSTTAAAMVDATTSTTTPTVDAADIATIEAYEAAFNAGDEAGLRSVLDAGASRADVWNENSSTGNVDTIVEWMIHQNAQESVMDVDVETCRLVGAKVACDVSMIGVVPRTILGIDALSLESFLIEDGRILGIEYRCSVCGTGAPSDAVRAWVLTQDPDEGALLARDPAAQGSAVSGALWLKWVQLWDEAGRP